MLSGRPGAATLSAYGEQPSRRSRCRSARRDLSRSLGSRHLGAGAWTTGQLARCKRRWSCLLTGTRWKNSDQSRESELLGPYMIVTRDAVSWLSWLYMG